MAEWRFLLDENIDPKAVTYLGKKGIAADQDVTVMFTRRQPSSSGTAPRKRHWITMSSTDSGTPSRNTLDGLPGYGFRKNQRAAVRPLLDDHDNRVYDVSGIMFGHPGFWTAPFLPEAEWKDHRNWVTEHLIEAHVQAHKRWEAILTGYPDRVYVASMSVDSGTSTNHTSTSTNGSITASWAASPKPTPGR